MDIKDSYSYVVPWVDGPNGFPHPFGLGTNYGFVIFVFNVGSARFNGFFEVSVGSLAPGFQLTTTALLVPSPEQISTELAKHVTQVAQFAVAVEGSREFDRMWDELSTGTIWPD
jgi:hypothetical protein